MILFRNDDGDDVDLLIREGIQNSVCDRCSLTHCKDEDGFDCDLMNPIVVTIKRKPTPPTAQKTLFDLDAIAEDDARHGRV